jgi:hypothetical protein
MTATPKPPCELEPSVPEDLERVVLSCLAKRPDERPQGAAALSELLAKCAAAGEWTQQVAQTWWAEHRSEVMLRVEGGGSDPQTKTMTVAIDASAVEPESEPRSETA